MCGCSKKNNTNKISLCKSITVTILSSWRDKIICALIPENKINFGNEYIVRMEHLKSILNVWIDYKNSEPLGCMYNENLREVQIIINYIKTKTNC